MAPPFPAPSKEDIENFSIAVARTAREKDISYLDALTLVCEKRNIEAEVAASLLDGVIKDRVRQDAESLNMMKVKRNRLPI